jgi:hypothetical protein
METLARFDELRMDYEKAFERLCIEVAKLKSQEPDARPEVVAELRLRIEQAEDAYRQKRDDLAQFLMDQIRTAELVQVA